MQAKGKVFTMKETIIALYDSLGTAEVVVQDLLDNAFDPSHINLVINDAERKYGHLLDRSGVEQDVSGGEGAGFGSMVGGLTGLIAGLAAITIPGIGPVIAAGPLAAVLGGLTGAAIGAGAGAITGGITASLVDMGIPEDASAGYAEFLRRGGTMVAVTVEEKNVPYVMDILKRHQPINLDERMAAWRQEGWAGYDPNAQPLTIQDIERERMMTRANINTLSGQPVDHNIYRFPGEPR